MACEDGDYAIEVYGMLKVPVKPELRAREVGLARDGRAAGDRACEAGKWAEESWRAKGRSLMCAW